MPLENGAKGVMWCGFAGCLVRKGKGYQERVG
jgi:hypothetical protein